MKRSFFIFACLVLGGVFISGGAILAYNTEGILVSKNLLPTGGASIIHSVTVDVDSLPVGTTLQISFSKDGVAWYDSAGTHNALDTLSSGSNRLDLSALDWRSGAFYYRILFTSTGDSAAVVDSVVLTYLDDASVWNTYNTDETLTSANLLSGHTATSIDAFDYVATDIPDGTGMTAQFSTNNSDWYNSAGTPGGSDTLSSGSNTIDLSGLFWTGTGFYYKINFTSDNTDTPVLDSVTLDYKEQVATESGIQFQGMQLQGIEGP